MRDVIFRPDLVTSIFDLVFTPLFCICDVLGALGALILPKGALLGFKEFFFFDSVDEKFEFRV